ncbi:MAG: glycosyltransferase family 1 protein [Kiritimatiellae bacterium]|nr:glycosyltransferase family 1 protein [Kiritimatiellia bacterium]
MNRITSIITARFLNKEPWRDIIYEWEDVLADALNAKLADCRKCTSAPPDGAGGGLSLTFKLQAKQAEHSNRRDVVPWIIDFYLRTDEELQTFYNAFSRNPLVLVSSREAYEFLKEKRCPLNIRHVGLSLPDKYALKPDAKFEKKYDVLNAGRPSKQMAEWLERYADSHPGFVYVMRQYLNTEKHYAVAVTQKNEKVGYCDTREQYFGLLRMAKVSMYSTQSIDGDRQAANGYNQVTPRFLEILACGCKVISRYADNPDTDWYDMKSMSTKVDTYGEFEAALDKARAGEADIEKSAKYLARHLTSARVKDILEAVGSLP